MRIRILAVPDCPNASLARERIDAALDGRTAHVETVDVQTEEQAVALGMTGSPTLLVDGHDPFAADGLEAGLSCRLYRGPDGSADGAPTVAQLQAALGTDCAGACCGGAVEGAAQDVVEALVGRGGRGRTAPGERGLRAVHQAVLRSFATTGRAPERRTLEPVAAAHARTAGEVLAELAREDFLTLDEAGAIRAAYPFSAVPTEHRVRIGDVVVWSMCAIDALGIPAMLDRDVIITSTDPVDGGPVTVTATDGTLTWDPPGAVVFAGMPADRTGPAADTCCRTLNFFTGPATAATWRAAHPDVPGQVLDGARAEEIGAAIFGPLLRD